MTRTQGPIGACFTAINVVRTVVLLLMAWGLFLPTIAAADQVSVRLVSARDHIEGGMTTDRSVYTDETRIYLATSKVEGGQGQGTLFVLARDRAANFPVLESIHYSSPLFAVRGDLQNLYVAAGDGKLLVYRKGPQLVLVQAVPLASYSLNALAITDDRVFVAVGQTRFAVNDGRVYLNALNEGDFVVELSKQTLTPVRVYGEDFEGGGTIVFERQTGVRLAAISFQGNLYAAGMFVMGTHPGCCGAGIFVHDADSLLLDQFIGHGWTNTVVQRDGLLIAGSEAGNVDIFGIHQNPSPMRGDYQPAPGHWSYRPKISKFVHCGQINLTAWFLPEVRGGTPNRGDPCYPRFLCWSRWVREFLTARSVSSPLRAFRSARDCGHGERRASRVISEYGHCDPALRPFYR